MPGWQTSKEGFGTHDRLPGLPVVRAWLHILRDRLTVEVAAHFAVQLPELLRGVFYDGWNPSRVPMKYGRGEYLTRFAREARVHDSDVPRLLQWLPPWSAAYVGRGCR